MQIIFPSQLYHAFDEESNLNELVVMYYSYTDEEYGEMDSYLMFEYDEKEVKYTFYDTKENADLYGILAYWNKCDGMIFDGEEYPSTMEDILKRGNTRLQSNRCKGIDIGCYDEQVDNLKYPLKLVSASYKGTYETCDMRSYGDPNQGFYKTYW